MFVNDDYHQLMVCFRHSDASVLQHAAVLLGSAVGFAGLSDCLAQRSVSGTHRHLHRPPHRAMYANAAGQAGTKSGLQSSIAGGSAGTIAKMSAMDVWVVLIYLFVCSG